MVAAHDIIDPNLQEEAERQQEDEESEDRVSDQGDQAAAAVVAADDDDDVELARGESAQEAMVGDNNERQTSEHSRTSSSTNNFYQCCICSEHFQRENPQGCSGGGGETHYQCTACELDYLRTELAPGRAFDSKVWMGGKEGEPGALASEPEQLPCPRFQSGDCDCAAMPLAGLYGLLSVSEEISVLYRDALQRVVESKLQDASNNKVHEEERTAKAVQGVHQAVEKALTTASLMKCPHCSCPGPTSSDSAHMIICCEQCGTRWCYCCGRPRPEPGSDYCRGCDVGPKSLDEVPGWGDYAIASEHSGAGARHEFHRQRMRYYVQNIKKNTPSDVWEAFQLQYPHILQDVPTDGRGITWNELDDPSSSLPPLFGNSSEDDLLWKVGGGERTRADVVAVAFESGGQDRQRRLPSTREQVCFYVWMVLTVSSTVCLVALAPHNHGTPKVWSMAVSCISMIFGACSVLAYLFIWEIFVGKLAEGVILALLLTFWSAALPVLMDPSNEICLRDPFFPYDFREGLVIVDANLYFLSWVCFAAVLYLSWSLVHEQLGAFSDLNTSPRSAQWFGLAVSSLVVVASAVREFKSVPQCQSYPSLHYCKRTKCAIAIGTCSFVLSILVTLLQYFPVRLRQNYQLWLETAIATLFFVLWCIGVRFIAFGEDSPGDSIGNLFFATWVSFLLIVVLFASCFRESINTVRQQDDAAG